MGVVAKEAAEVERPRETSKRGFRSSWRPLLRLSDSQKPPGKKSSLRWFGLKNWWLLVRWEGRTGTVRRGVLSRDESLETLGSGPWGSTLQNIPAGAAGAAEVAEELAGAFAWESEGARCLGGRRAAGFGYESSSSLLESSLSEEERKNFFLGRGLARSAGAGEAAAAAAVADLAGNWEAEALRFPARGAKGAGEEAVAAADESSFWEQKPTETLGGVATSAGRPPEGNLFWAGMTLGARGGRSKLAAVAAEARLRREGPTREMAIEGVGRGTFEEVDAAEEASPSAAPEEEDEEEEDTKDAADLRFSAGVTGGAAAAAAAAMEETCWARAAASFSLPSSRLEASESG